MSTSDDPSKVYDDQEWKNVADREERRRIQNRNAQRRHRDRRRQEDEEKQRIATNRDAAGAAYTPAKLQDDSKPPEGLPWGAFALSSKKTVTGVASSSRSSTEHTMIKRKASDDDLSSSWHRDSSATRAGPGDLLEVPRSFSRSLVPSSSVPQLREAAMQQRDNRRSSSVRSRSRGGSPGRLWPGTQQGDTADLERRM